MNERNSYQSLLLMIEAALAEVGCSLPAADREQMADLLGRMDRVRTRQGAEALNEELEYEQEGRAENVMVSCDPEVWLAAAECA